MRFGLGGGHTQGSNPSLRFGNTRVNDIPTRDPTFAPWAPMSALARMTDSSRTAPHFRKAPKSEVRHRGGSILLRFQFMIAAILTADDL
jgi:hypothetical protein